MGQHLLFFVLILSSQVFADLAIKKLVYDEVTDELVVSAQFPGKCLVHELKLMRGKTRGKKNYFRLAITNNNNDPCNALNEKTERFSLKEITDRPAELLVSAQQDGSKPHYLTIPPHPQATIMSVGNLNNGSLVFSLHVRGPTTADRFYVDVDCSNANGSHCDGIVRDTRGHAYPHEPVQTKEIVLKPNFSRSQNLVFSLGDRRGAVRILVQ